MKEIFKFIIAVIILIYCLPIIALSVLVVLWNWDGISFNNTLENIHSLVRSIIEPD